MFGKKTKVEELSVDVPSVDKLKAEIVEKLSHRTTKATCRLVEVNSSIAKLSDSITDVEAKKSRVEKKLHDLQENALPDKKTLNEISVCLLEIQALEKTLNSWNDRIPGLNEEKSSLLLDVQMEAVGAFKDVLRDLQKIVDIEAAKFTALLITVETAAEECRLVTGYVPALKGVNAVAVTPPPAYRMHCPPVDLAKRLRSGLPWLV
jgi:predicted RNase H-like nuclease (RuvC/YqgF family)